MKIIKILLVIAMFLVAVSLGSMNQQTVTFNYLVAQNELHLSTILAIIFAVGFGVAWIIFSGLYFKAKFTIRRLNKQLAKKTALLEEKNKLLSGSLD